MAQYMAQMAGHSTHAYLSTLPEESKGPVYEKAMEILAYEAEQETISEAVH